MDLANPAYWLLLVQHRKNNRQNQGKFKDLVQCGLSRVRLRLIWNKKWVIVLRNSSPRLKGFQIVLDACLRRHDGIPDFLRVCQYSNLRFIWPNFKIRWHLKFGILLVYKIFWCKWFSIYFEIILNSPEFILILTIFFSMLVPWWFAGRCGIIWNTITKRPFKDDTSLHRSDIIRRIKHTF